MTYVRRRIPGRSLPTGYSAVKRQKSSIRKTESNRDGAALLELPGRGGGSRSEIHLLVFDELESYCSVLYCPSINIPRSRLFRN